MFLQLLSFGGAGANVELSETGSGSCPELHVCLPRLYFSQ